MNLGVCAILWVGGIQVNVGELTQGQVMAFVNYMTQTLTSIVYVANLVVVFYQGERERVAYQRGAQLRAEHHRRGQPAGCAARVERDGQRRSGPRAEL